MKAARGGSSRRLSCSTLAGFFVLHGSKGFGGLLRGSFSFFLGDEAFGSVVFHQDFGVPLVGADGEHTILDRIDVVQDARVIVVGLLQLESLDVTHLGLLVVKR